MAAKKTKKFGIRRIGLIGIISVIVFVFFFYIYYSSPYWNKSLLWRDIKVSNIKLSENGPKYEVSNGYLIKDGRKRKIQVEINPITLVENEKVLRLALYYQINKEDPLFIGPGNEVNKHKNNVNRLINSHAELLKATELKDNVMPINFLKKTSEVKTEYKKFIDNPAYENAGLLKKIILETDNAYKKDADGLINKLEKLNLKQEKFVESGSVTTKTIILGDLKKISNNYASIKNEVDSRGRCLEVSALFCRRTIKKAAVDGDVSDKDESAVSILNSNELYYPEEKSKIKLSGPYKLQTDCWLRNGSQDRSQYLYQMEITSESGAVSYVPKIATTNYYQQTSRGAAGNIDKQYEAHELQWRAVLITSPYSCSELDFNPELATIDSYYKEYKGKDILDSIDLGKIPDKYKDTISGGKEIEDKFFSQKYPSWQTLEKMSKYYQNIYSLIIEEENNGNGSEWLGDVDGKKDELLTRYLYIDRKMGNIDKVLNYLSFFLDRYSQTYKLNTGNREGYIYYIRNSYPLTYLGFGSSVWRSNNSLEYLKRDEYMSPSIKEYAEMVSMFGKDYVIKNMNVPRSQIYVEMLGYDISE